ncbi:MAG: hypothetical protein Ct9H300mP3_05250 [Gammaproteobacteria bacterium]|nr:MAG: hypothetical protein Ct9H300mP3_05250 [Gammaproteobacteria bacterium]
MDLQEASEVASHLLLKNFASLGITVVDADVVSRTVVEPGMPALKEIESHFGSEII